MKPFLRRLGRLVFRLQIPVGEPSRTLTGHQTVGVRVMHSIAYIVVFEGGTCTYFQLGGRSCLGVVIAVNPDPIMSQVEQRETCLLYTSPSPRDA